MGRKPTDAEYEEERDNGMAALLKRMQDDGVVVTPTAKEEVYIVKKHVIII